MKSLASLGRVNWLLPILFISLLSNAKVWAYGEVDKFMLGWKTIFVKAHGNLEHVEEMLKEEIGKHGSVFSALNNTAEMDFEKKLEAVKKQMPWHKFILECKYFVQKLFAENHAHKEHRDEIFSYKARHIWQLSQVDTGDLDQLLLALLYSTHLKEKSKTRHPEPFLLGEPHILESVPFTRALVVGIGPIGLYTTLQLFMAGIETIVVGFIEEFMGFILYPYKSFNVTDAPNSVRNSICLLEPKFMVQFRILFGHKFNGLFGDPLKFVDLIQSGKNWPLKCQDFVSALKERLTELKAFVHGHEKNSTKSLELLFDSHMGKFVKPANSPDIVATLSSNVQQKQKKKVAVDILIITNNEEGHPAQSLYLDKMEENMSPKRYGIAVIDKYSAGEHIFANGDGPNSKQLPFELTEMKEFLPEGGFDKVIGQEPELAYKFENFDQLLLHGPVLQYDRFIPHPSVFVQNHYVTIHEVGALIYFVVSTPWALEKLVNELEVGKAMNWRHPEMVHKLKQQIERIWFLTVFKFCLSKLAPSFTGNIKFNLDENGNIVHTLDQWKDKIKHGQIKFPENGQTLLFVDPANTSTFPVDFKDTKEPALYVHDQKGLLLTLGDSLATPNALVENGLSIDLLAVENTVNLLKEFQQDSIANRSDLCERLTDKLNASKKIIMHEATDFVKKSESVDENAMAEGKGQKTDMTDDEHFYPY